MHQPLCDWSLIVYWMCSSMSCFTSCSVVLGIQEWQHLGIFTGTPFKQWLEAQLLEPLDCSPEVLGLYTYSLIYLQYWTLFVTQNCLIKYTLPWNNIIFQMSFKTMLSCTNEKRWAGTYHYINHWQHSPYKKWGNTVSVPLSLYIHLIQQVPL